MRDPTARRSKEGCMSKIFETPLYPYRRSPDQDAKTPVRHPVIVIGAVGLVIDRTFEMVISVTKRYA
jgi:hypothetical protein